MKHIKPASARNANIALQILISLSLLYSLYYKVFFVPYSKKILAVIWIAQFILLFISQNKSLRFELYILIVYLVILNCYVFFIIYDRILLTDGLFLTLIGITIGYLLVENEINELTITLPFIIILTFVFVVVFKGIRTFENNNFFNINRNMLPKFVVSYGILIDIIRFNKGKKRSWIWVATFILILSFITKSRTAIVVSALYFLIVLINNEIFFYHKISKDRRLVYSLIIIILTILVIVVLLYLILSDTRFAESGYSSSGRDVIYKTVFSEISTTNIFRGFRSTVFNTYANLHNSYLQFITTGGVGAFALLLLYLVLEIVLLMKAPYLFILSSLFFLYSLPEYFMFFREGDFALMPLMALAISYLRKRKDKAAG